MSIAIAILLLLLLIIIIEGLSLLNNNNNSDHNIVNNNNNTDKNKNKIFTLDLIITITHYQANKYTIINLFRNKGRVPCRGAPGSAGGWRVAIQPYTQCHLPDKFPSTAALKEFETLQQGEGGGVSKSLQGGGGLGKPMALLGVHQPYPWPYWGYTNPTHGNL